MNTSDHFTFPSSIPIKTRSEDGRTEGMMCSKLSKSPRKFFDNRLALNFTSSSCVDLNLEKAVGSCEASRWNFITLGIPEFRPPVFAFCRFPRRHCYRSHQMHTYTGDGKREVCGESFRATKCPTLSPFVRVYRSGERAATRARHIPTFQCFLTVSGNSTCLGMCQSRKA